MKITDVKVKVLDTENRLKAVSNITIDECFVVHEIRIIDGKEGLFVAMPSRKLPNGSFRDIAHPINQETRKLVEDAVLAEYNKTLEADDSSDSKDSKKEEK
jgi:stage V sporulation protein G